MYCEIHGEGSKWGNPWLTNINNLLKGLGCPKCSGLYKRTEDELEDELKLIPRAKGVSIGARVTPFKSNNTRYRFICETHGDSSEWGTPSIPSASQIKKQGCVKCYKCEGTYNPSCEEIISILKNKFADQGLQVLDWVDPKKTGVNEAIYVSCEIHGHGKDWERPWTPSYNILKSCSGCLKCHNSYRPTQREYLSMAQAAIDKKSHPHRLIVTGFTEETQNIHARLDIQCPLHGAVLTKKKHHHYLKRVLSIGAHCIDCEKGRSQSFFEEFQTKQKNNYHLPKKKNIVEKKPTKSLKDKVNTLFKRETNISFIRFDHHKITNSSLCYLNCKEHGDMWEFKNPHIPSVKRLLSTGASCPKCNGVYKETNKELTELANNVLEPHGCFVKNLVGGEYRERLVNLQCKIHGESNSWGKPWLPSLSYVLSEAINTDKSFCQKCNGQYVGGKEEVVEKIKEIAATRGLSFKDIVIENSNISTSVLHLHCEEHGKTWLWEKPWLPTVNHFTRNEVSGCPRCRGFRLPVSKRLEIANEIWAKKPWSVTGIDSSTNDSKADSKANFFATCEEHGDGWTWSTPWLPTLDSIREGKGCPKCSGRYRLSKKKLLKEVSKACKKRALIFHGTVGQFKRTETYLDIECPQHGRGVDMTPIWTPTYINFLKRNISCPLCLRNTRTIKNYLEAISNGEKEISRTLYYVEFIDKKGRFFYKVGVAKADTGVCGRFHKSELAKDQVSISRYTQVTIDNGVALLLEATILAKFKKERDYSRIHTLNVCGGGTECFSSNIIDRIDLRKVLDEALANKTLISSFELNENRKSLLFEHIRKHRQSIPKHFNAMLKWTTKKTLSSL
tara:strand:+ start:364 stop:2892 length:2529 start_codon:yes stop_codon:yes gene_type:complete